jgi:hypothetical protein
MLEILQEPFVMGLCIGLLLAVWIWGNGLMKRRELRKEVDKMKDHLGTQMEISNRGNKDMLAEVEKLRKGNEDLRVANATLKQKPGRQELQQLHVYDKALRILFQKAPGFAGAWESAVTEAEKELSANESGLMPFVRKLLTTNSAGEEDGKAEEVVAGETKA